MIVYGHRSFTLDLHSFRSRLSARVDAAGSSPAALMDLLVDFGEAECAVADALLPDIDDENIDVDRWRAAGAALADAFCASAAADRAAVSHHLGRVHAHTPALEGRGGLRLVDARTSEGFACYALHPEQYIDAARRLLAATNAQSVFCLGLRSAGSVLGHVVAAACRAAGVDADFRSVRPRGHPFDRRLRIGDRLEATIRGAAATTYAVIDEGPGLSGSSFAAAVEALGAIGIAAERIALVPSWDAPIDALRSERGRRVWSAHGRFVGAVDQARLAADAIGGVSSSHLVDYSAGRWRDNVFAASRRGGWPPAQPQHERVKFLDPASRTIARFAGLGRYGRLKQHRAAALADAGFSAAPVRLSNGYLALRWVEGEPLIACDGVVDVSPGLIERLADYLAVLLKTFATGKLARTDDLFGMLHANVREGLGSEHRAAVDRLPTVFQEPEVRVDGRMLPHEWIRSSQALIKTDALDHHADDFLPGCRDIAWDVAGTIVEFGMNEAAAAALLDRYACASGDSTIRARIPFYTAAYLAYRLGYVSLAGDTTAEPDATVFRRAGWRYRRSLAARLARPGAGARC